MAYYCNECQARLPDNQIADCHIEAYGEEVVICRECYKKNEQLNEGKVLDKPSLDSFSSYVRNIKDKI